MRVSELLANGAPVDGAPNSKDGSTALVPLVAAIKDGNLEIVRQLLLHGARVDAPDEQESTALILACMYVWSRQGGSAASRTWRILGGL